MGSIVIYKEAVNSETLTKFFINCSWNREVLDHCINGWYLIDDNTWNIVTFFPWKRASWFSNCTASTWDDLISSHAVSLTFFHTVRFKATSNTHRGGMNLRDSGKARGFACAHAETSTRSARGRYMLIYCCTFSVLFEVLYSNAPCSPYCTLSPPPPIRPRFEYIDGPPFIRSPIVLILSRRHDRSGINIDLNWTTVEKVDFRGSQPIQGSSMLQDVLFLDRIRSSIY